MNKIMKRIMRMLMISRLIRGTMLKKGMTMSLRTAMRFRTRVTKVY